MNRKGKHRLTIDIPVEIHKELKRISKENNTTMTNITIQIFEKFILEMNEIYSE